MRRKIISGIHKKTPVGGHDPYAGEVFSDMLSSKNCP